MVGNGNRKEEKDRERIMIRSTQITNDLVRKKNTKKGKLEGKETRNVPKREKRKVLRVGVETNVAMIVNDVIRKLAEAAAEGRGDWD